ncbi:MAG: hypothetical protein GX201_07195 [Clostridiales bacterium]|jgi:hypothetical protein|nr:hypothetical protein [Clostridiales bacterium]
MNETLIKELIKYKIKIANEIINLMPPNAADEIRKISRIVMEGIEEGCKSLGDTGYEGKNKINNIIIK